MFRIILFFSQFHTNHQNVKIMLPQEVGLPGTMQLISCHGVSHMEWSRIPCL